MHDVVPCAAVEDVGAVPTVHEVAGGAVDRGQVSAVYLIGAPAAVQDVEPAAAGPVQLELARAASVDEVVPAASRDGVDARATLELRRDGDGGIDGDLVVAD